MSQSLAAVPAVPGVVIHDAEALRRRSRRRTLLMLGAVSVGWKVLVFTLGAAIPRWLIADGVDELPAAHRVYGAASLVTARALFDSPIERLGRVVQRVRVVSVDSIAPPSATDAGSARPVAAGCAMGARVRAYTYFAIPYSEVRTRCDRGVIAYRLLPRAGRVE